MVYVHFHLKLILKSGDVAHSGVWNTTISIERANLFEATLRLPDMKHFLNCLGILFLLKCTFYFCPYMLIRLYIKSVAFYAILCHAFFSMRAWFNRKLQIGIYECQFLQLNCVKLIRLRGDRNNKNLYMHVFITFFLCRCTAHVIFQRHIYKPCIHSPHDLQKFFDCFKILKKMWGGFDSWSASQFFNEFHAWRVVWVELECRWMVVLLKGSLFS